MLTTNEKAVKAVVSLVWEVLLTDPQTLLRHSIAVATSQPRMIDLRASYPGVEVTVKRHGHLPHGTFKLSEVFDFGQLFSTMETTNELVPDNLTVEDIAPNESVVSFKGMRSLVWPRYTSPLATSRRRINVDYAEMKAQEHQLWLLGTRTFAPVDQGDLGDLDAEEAFFAARDAAIDRKAINSIRSAVKQAFREENLVFTPAQKKRAQKKINRAKGGYAKKVTPPKRKVSKVVIKVAYMMAVSTMVRGNKLALRHERKETMAIAVASRRLLDVFRGFTLNLSGLDDLASDDIQINQMKEKHMNIVAAWNNNKEVK